MAKDPLKVVVRLLPPEITEEELIGTISQSHVQRTKWRAFEPGKRYKGEAKASVNSRCYFQFEAFEYAEDFIKDYHGHQFVDGQGEQFRAVACFAPYQKAPRSKSQKDPRDGTIADDPAYKEFVEKLAEASKVIYEAPPDPKQLLRPTDLGDTPLLKYMQTRAKERHAAAKKKKERRWREMETISEEPKKAKWRCTECGTSKHLEEDPDDRGTFYCTYCWESWENHQAPAPKVKKKKKKGKEAEEAEAAEEAEEAPGKKKKKKRDKEREAEEGGGKPEWRAKEKDEDPEKRRRKKKDREREEEEEEEDDRGKNRWRVKKQEPSEAKGSKGGQEEWWEEEKPKKKAEKKSDAADDSRASRWRAKAPAGEDAAEAEEKPRRKTKEKKPESESGYWRPKS